MTDLVKHIFDMAATMNRVAAAAHKPLNAETLLGNKPLDWRSPMHATDEQIESLHAMERHNKRAVRFGREILMMDDLRIEALPTENAAKLYLKSLEEVGYFVSAAPVGDTITYAERFVCERIEVAP